MTIIRKKVNAMRRRYQKTTNNQALREIRKNQYLEEKRKYEREIKKQKHNSWKEYCSLTPTNNPWNAVYRLATGKGRKHAQLTTLEKSDGTMTQNLTETMNFMLENFTPEDKKEEDTDHHKSVRERS